MMSVATDAHATTGSQGSSVLRRIVQSIQTACSSSDGRFLFRTGGPHADAARLSSSWYDTAVTTAVHLLNALTPHEVKALLREADVSDEEITAFVAKERADIVDRKLVTVLVNGSERQRLVYGVLAFIARNYMPQSR